METLLLALTLLLTIFAARCDANIRCHSYSNTPDHYLRDDVGLEQCTSTDSCYEAVGKPGNKDQIFARYTAGCGERCPYLNFDADCRICSTSLCNNGLLKQVKESNLLCYLATDEPVIGPKTIWCSKGVTTCSWSSYGPHNAKKYHGSCSDVCVGSDCTTCKTELCNVPDDMKQSAVKRSPEGAGGGNNKAAPSHAGITCYTNGASAENLREDVGAAGLMKCASAGFCYEAFGKPGAGHKDAMYSSGCGKDCPKLSFEAQCKNCSESLCNDVFSKEIRANHLLCYSASDEPGIGAKKIWCAKGVKNCYWRAEVNHKEKKYYAGCLQPWPDCTECTFCKTPLCNLPEELQQSAVGQRKAANTTGKANGKGDAAEEAGPDYDNYAVLSASAAFSTVLTAALAAAIAKMACLRD